MRLGAALALALALPAPLHALESESPTEMLSLSSSRGLTGMRELVDARTPAGEVHGRLGSRFAASSEANRTKGGAWERVRERYELAHVVGFSLADHVDLGLRVPIPTVESTRTHARILNGPDDQEKHTVGGGGNLSVAAKGSLGLGPVTLAPYLILSPRTGGKALAHDEEFLEAAGATSVELLGENLVLHVNLGGKYLYERRDGLAFRYRVGASVSPHREERFAVRVFAYGDGLEYEESLGSDLRLGAGVQLLLADRFQLELTAERRVLADHLDMGLDDRGTWAAELGFAFIF